MKKKCNLLKIFYSMKCAIVLLILVCVACTVASLIPQEKTARYYEANYNPVIAKAIVTLQFDNAFTSWWFASLTALLCINLLLCNIMQFPHIFKAYKASCDPHALLAQEDFFVGYLKPDNIRILFETLAFKKITTYDTVTFASKNKIALWGAWLCHIGMLVIIVGFVLGQIFTIEENVYGVEKAHFVVPNTSLAVTIDKFEVQLRSDFTVQQYISNLTVENRTTGEKKSGTAMVNYPLDVFGYTFYQNSTGWANDVKVWKNNELTQEKTIHIGETLALDGIPVTLALFKFYPDFYDDGHEPISKTPLVINPKTQFALYYEQNLLDVNYIGMNEDIKLDNYLVRLSNPQPYTLIQVRKDPALPIVAFGGLVLIIALFIAFYLHFAECAVIVQGDCAKVYARCPKGKKIFTEKIIDRIKTLA